MRVRTEIMTPLRQSDVLAALDEMQKSKGGRPKIHPDRKAYKAEKERERRKRLAALKAAKETK